MSKFRKYSVSLATLLLIGLMSTNLLASRNYDNGSSSSGNTTSSLPSKSVRNLVKTYLDDFQAVDPNITARDLLRYIYSLNASTMTEAEAGLQDYLASLQETAVVNQPPSISGSPAGSVTAGENYSFTPDASDVDSSTLVFSVINMPPWANFDSSNGAIAGTPTASDVGLYSNIVISVSDGSDTTSLAPFSINVNARLGGMVGFASTTASVEEGSLVNVTVTRSNGAGTASVMYGTHGVTAVSSTTNGDDYDGFDPIAVTFAEGETSKVVSVQTLDNSDHESAETFEIYLTSPSTGYDLDVNSVITVTIVDNDDAPAAPNETGSTTLSWVAPSTRTDGTSLSMSEIDGYRIYMGDTTSDMAPVMDINDNSLTSYTLSDLSIGTHYFSVTVYDTNGNESGYSNIVNKSAL